MIGPVSLTGEVRAHAAPVAADARWVRVDPDALEGELLAARDGVGAHEVGERLAARTQQDGTRPHLCRCVFS